MGRRIEIGWDFCILWALLLLTLPLRLILAAGAAAVIHEICHGLAIYATGGKIRGLKVRAGGMAMETSPMTPGQEIFCALAGPAGSLAVAGLSRWIPLLGLCGLVQGCFNLLPLYPMDGGRVTACLLRIAAPERGDRIQQAIEWAVVLVLMGIAIRIGPAAIMGWGMLAFRKIPCKDGRFGVQ